MKESSERSAREMEGLKQRLASLESWRTWILGGVAAVCLFYTLWRDNRDLLSNSQKQTYSQVSKP
jgi:hypothetical protein